MNCLTLLHELNSKTHAWELEFDEKICEEYKTRIDEINNIFEKRHPGENITWELVDDCKCK